MIVMDPAIAPVTIVLVGAGTAILVVIHRVNMIPMQAATIRALSLTVGRDRTKNTEGSESRVQFIRRSGAGGRGREGRVCALTRLRRKPKGGQSYVL